MIEKIAQIGRTGTQCPSLSPSENCAIFQPVLPTVDLLLTQKLRSFHEKALYYPAVHWAQKLRRGDQQASVPASIKFSLPAADCQFPPGIVQFLLPSPNNWLPVLSSNCAIFTTSDPAKNFQFPLGIVQFWLPSSQPAPPENCTIFSCWSSMQPELFLHKIVQILLSNPHYSLVLENAQILCALPLHSLDCSSQDLCSFSFQPSQTSRTLTVISDCPSSPPNDSCTVFISSAKSHHPTSQPYCLSRSPTFEMIICHGRLGGFWIWCCLVMSDCKYRYTKKHGATTNAMNEGSTCQRLGSPTDKWTMHEKRCARERMIMQICIHG